MESKVSFFFPNNFSTIMHEMLSFSDGLLRGPVLMEYEN